jgi:segregation and condensation protein B
VPGRPALYATTRQFLDDLNLRSLQELPALDQFVINEQLLMGEPAPSVHAQEEEPLTHRDEDSKTAAGAETTIEAVIEDLAQRARVAADA